jgi:hypothetical protein
VRRPIAADVDTNTDVKHNILVTEPVNGWIVAIEAVPERRCCVPSWLSDHIGKVIRPLDARLRFQMDDDRLSLPVVQGRVDEGSCKHVKSAGRCDNGTTPRVQLGQKRRHPKHESRVAVAH